MPIGIRTRLPSSTGTAISTLVAVLSSLKSFWIWLASGEIRLHEANATAKATVASARLM
jgi:hypothetical protein